MWKGEDEMEITAGKQFSLAVIEPLFLYEALALGAMPVSA
jgi:hypothetical protein